ncbi:glucan 1,4-alpha-glucosidase KNAG_0H02080 [Huiozyma naganishii CBS 8797]|uniref:glucan 1,4-alpha-glucosidase n=1 Tax=Huiozyma naganishii (strain ATCC MYA-139 / BCRC 22969 / CBS 8797 / KCTC 17520 / NBRC 10181 / NCYC 3082 / Yp74L-3) TaxID=1071383 RepID=J7S1T2_HUIN7|nr:hypothetical protein KNAG_0H02080 [Kazachstania naganishii CBS 8797]CCK71622.1 hypothetical protein KNAG_0H02080 [Kazachstania naganishii CBS 8797]
MQSVIGVFAVVLVLVGVCDWGRSLVVAAAACGKYGLFQDACFVHDESVTLDYSDGLLDQQYAALVNRTDLEAWFEQEVQWAKERIQANIIVQAGVSVVVASPSKVAPDYYYQWVRDSAMTMLTFNDWRDELGDTAMGVLEGYLRNVYLLQRVDNLSGDFADNGANLGEPKFLVDNSPFNEPWGRPQNDGPPLRLISSLKILNDTEYGGALQQAFDTICLPDLNFVLDHWQDEHFDLWEEVRGQHFFTSMVQLYSIDKTIRFLQETELQTADALKLQLQTVRNNLQQFVGAQFASIREGIVVETPSNLGDRPSGLDIAVVLASLLVHPIDESTDGLPFDIDARELLETFHRLVQEMRDLYPINAGLHDLSGVALGRYPEDVYDGVGISEANPWFLCTAVGANLMYRLVTLYDDKKSDLVIPLNNSGIWQRFVALDTEIRVSHKEVVIPYHSQAFNKTLGNIFNFGDSFLSVIQSHVSDDGEMSEQFNKYTGYLTGASHLTWSYCEFLNAIKARDAAKSIL